MTTFRSRGWIARPIAVLCVLAAASGCGRPDRYTLVCRMTGPSTGTGSEYRFPIDEPARRMVWSSAAGMTPIAVGEWTDARIRGRFMVGESSVTIDLDRAQGNMVLVHRNPLRGEDANRGPCHVRSSTGEETKQLTEAEGANS